MVETQADLSLFSTTPSRSGNPSSVPLPPWRWKTRVLLPGAIALLFFALLAYGGREALWPAIPVHVLPIVVKSSAEAGTSASFQAAGWLEAEPYMTHVSALADGIVKEVLVLEGQRVKAGEVVARLIDDDARLALARAEAEVQGAAAACKAARREWEQPVERTRAQAVAEAKLAQGRGELEKLAAEVVMAIAQVAEMEEQLRSEIQAGSGKTVPEFQIAQSRLKLRSTEAALAVVRARKPILEGQVRQLEAEALEARELLRLRIPETKLLEETQANLARVQAQREEAQLKLRRMEILAPVEGVVLERHVTPGAKLMLLMDDPKSSQAVSLYDPERLQVRVDVPLGETPGLSVGQGVKIEVEALPGRTFEGQVTRILHQADIQKNTLQVKVALRKPAPELKPEMLARAQFMAMSLPAKGPGGGGGTQVVYAPEKFLQREGATRAKAWIVDQGRGVAIQREVTLGTRRLEGWVEVTAGLLPGDRIIVDGPADLREGQKVKVLGEMEEHTGGPGHGVH